jgi:hypothetical protein
MARQELGRGYEGRSTTLTAYSVLQQEVLVAHRLWPCCSLWSPLVELLRWHRARIIRSLRCRPCETGRGQCVRLELYCRVRALTSRYTW